MTLALILTAALAVGVSLGLLGGGGSILTVPLLVYVAGADPKQAIAMSLFVVGATALAGVLPHARAGRVRWRTGLLFGVAGMIGAYAGGRLAGYLPAPVLLAAFAVMMAVTALAMLRRSGTPAAPASATAEHPVPRILAEGAIVGLATGLVGAGGGFLVVPALVLLGGLAMPAAVGTSLLVITMKSFAGLAGYLHSVDLDWTLALAVTAAAAVGGLAGSRLAGHLDPDRLRQAFGWFVLAMAAFVLTEQAPADARHAVFATPTGWLALTAVLALATTTLLARKNRTARREDRALTAHLHDADR